MFSAIGFHDYMYQLSGLLSDLVKYATSKDDNKAVKHLQTQVNNPVASISTICLRTTHHNMLTRGVPGFYPDYFIPAISLHVALFNLDP